MVHHSTPLIHGDLTKKSGHVWTSPRANNLLHYSASARDLEDETEIRTQAPYARD